MAVKAQTTRSISFTDHLKQALELIDNSEALGGQSPLAAPYFLGDALRGVDATPAARGAALRAAIDRCLVTMWGGPLPDDGHAMLDEALSEEEQGGRYDCLILELNYLGQRYRPVPRNQAAIYHDILHISRPTHDRHLRNAIGRLGALLLQQLRPAVRPEQPIAPPALIGRDQLQQQALDDLEARQVGQPHRPGRGRQDLSGRDAGGRLDFAGRLLVHLPPDLQRPVGEPAFRPRLFSARPGRVGALASTGGRWRAHQGQRAGAGVGAGRSGQPAASPAALLRRT